MPLLEYKLSSSQDKYFAEPNKKAASHRFGPAWPYRRQPVCRPGLYLTIKESLRLLRGSWWSDAAAAPQ
jgi:hypothetical protein